MAIDISRLAPGDIEPSDLAEVITIKLRKGQLASVMNAAGVVIGRYEEGYAVQPIYNALAHIFGAEKEYICNHCGHSGYEKGGKCTNCGGEGIFMDANEILGAEQ